MRWGEIAIAVAIAAIAMLLPYHRSLRFPFALDDYTYLYQAAGFDPAPFSLRRWLAVRAYFELALKLFGPNPLGWHVVALALHVANATWVFVLARKLGVRREAAWVACGLFAASPLAFTVLYWVACIQELGCCFFLLASVYCALFTARARSASVALFALALLCKESVLVAPLAIAFVGGRPLRKLAAVQLGVGIVLFVATGVGRRMLESDPSLPYSTSYGTTLFLNLATHLVWFVAPWRMYPDRLATPQARLVLPALAVVAASLLFLRLDHWRRARAVAAAALWYVALLLPVLPLRSHSYAYYSYVPQIGFLILAGAGLGALGNRLHGSAAVALRAGLGFAAVAASILCAAQNARTHETLKLPNSAVPHDSVVRSARAAGAIVAAVHDAKLPPQTKRVLVLSLPTELGTSAPTPGSDKPKPGETRRRTFPLQIAVHGGKLFALHFPGMDGAWSDSMTARDETADTAIFFASGFNDLVKLPTPAEAYALEARGHLMTNDHVAAESDLRRVLELSPDHPAERLMLAGLLAESGRMQDAAAQLHQVAPEKLSDPLQSFYTQLSARLAAVQPSAPH